MIAARLPERDSGNIIDIPDKKVYFVIFLRHSKILQKWAYAVMTCDKDCKIYKAQLSSTSLKFDKKSQCVRAAHVRVKQCINWYVQRFGAELGQIFVKEM